MFYSLVYLYQSLFYNFNLYIYNLSIKFQLSILSLKMGIQLRAGSMSFLINRKKLNNAFNPSLLQTLPLYNSSNRQLELSSLQLPQHTPSPHHLSNSSVSSIIQRQREGQVSSADLPFKPYQTQQSRCGHSHTITFMLGTWTTSPYWSFV